MSDPIAVTIPEAVRLSGQSRTSIYEALKSNRLAARKAGRRTLVMYSDLERYIRELPVYQAAN